MRDDKTTKPDQGFFEIAFSRIVAIRAVNVSLVVGTLLAVINHSDKILNLSLSTQDWLKVVLTYIVPYAVSTWSSVAAMKENQSK